MSLTVLDVDGSLRNPAVAWAIALWSTALVIVAIVTARRFRANRRTRFTILAALLAIATPVFVRIIGTLFYVFPIGHFVSVHFLGMTRLQWLGPAMALVVFFGVASWRGRPRSMRTLFFVGSALCFLAACRAEDRTPAANVGAAPNAESPDHAVYTAVLREHFLRSKPGNEPVFCRSEAPDLLEIVGTTQPLPPGTPRRDAGWADHLPARAAPLLASLRAMDNQPGRALDRDGLAVGVPIRLVPHSVAARALQPTEPPATEPGPPLSWFSRVAYTAHGNWALVYAVEACTGVTEAMAAEAEGWAYDTVMLAPLERRAGVWTVHDPLYLDVGVPRLQPPD